MFSAPPRTPLQKPSLRAIGLAAFLSLAAPKFSTAQVGTEPDTKKPVPEKTSRSGNRAVPSEDKCHTIKLNYRDKLGILRTRNIDIHAGEGVQAGKSLGPYYIKPVPVLIQRSKNRPLDGAPTIVHDVREAANGTENLSFTFYAHISNENLLKLAAQELEMKYNMKGPFDVRPWPITGVVVRCWVTGSKDEPLGRIYRDDVKGLHKFDFTMNFNQSEAAEFMRAVQSSSIRFTYDFFYDGAFQSQITQDATVSTEASGKLRDMMKSRRWIQENGQPVRPLLAHEKQKLDEMVKTIYRESVKVQLQSGSASGAMALIDPAVSQTLLRLADPDKLSGSALTDILKNQSFRNALMQRLKPLINKTYTSKEDKDVTIKVKQKENIQQRGTNNSVGFKIGAVIKAISVGSSIGREKEKQHIQRVLDRIERQTGVRFVESSEKSVYVPESVNVWFLADLSQKAKFFYESVKTISIGTDGYLAPITVDLSLTGRDVLYDPEASLAGLQLNAQQTQAAYREGLLNQVDTIDAQENRRENLKASATTLQAIHADLEASHREYITTLSSLAGDQQKLLSSPVKTLLEKIKEEAAVKAHGPESEKEEKEAPSTQTLTPTELRKLIRRGAGAVDRKALEKRLETTRKEVATLTQERDALLEKTKLLTERTKILVADYFKLKQRKIIGLGNELLTDLKEMNARKTYLARAAWIKGFLAAFPDNSPKSSHLAWLKQVLTNHNNFMRSTNNNDARRNTALQQFRAVYISYIAVMGPIPGGLSFNYR